MTNKNFPIGLCYYDTDFRYTYVNDHLAAINGQPAEKHLGQRTAELSPEVADHLEAGLQSVIDTGEPIVNQIFMAQNPAQSDNCKHYEHNLYAIKSDAGEVIGVSCIVQEVARETQFNKELYSNILKLSSDGIISVDSKQRIRLFNQGATRIFGHEQLEAIGKPLDILLPVSSRGIHGKLVEKFGQSGDSSRVMAKRAEIMGRRKDGTLFPATASISKTELNGEGFLTVYINDISAIRGVEDSLHDLREELAHLNRIAMLEDISASLAHELNQPLASILLNAQVLNRYSQSDLTFPAEVKEILSDLISDAKRGGAVIQQMRKLLKPGQSPMVNLDLNNICIEIQNLLRSELRFKHIKLTMELAPALPAVRGVHVQQQQVLLNFMTNSISALKDVDRADRRIMIRTRQITPTEVELCVKDNGSGFKTKVTEQLFKSFYTTKSDGMGLGLAISKSIASDHGGRVWAEPNKGKGVSLYMTLPSANTEATAGRRVEHAFKSRTEQPDNTKVFLVDDDPSIRKAQGRLIESAGYMVETFSSAEAFLQREGHNDCACLVVDLHMPGLSGTDLQSELNKRNYTMPIIFVTGEGHTSSGVLAMKQGAMDFLEKPVDGEELLALIAQAIKVDFQARSQHAQQTSANEKITRLTPREAEVMELVVKGRLNKQIAYTLGIAEKTVKVHRGRVMRKLEVRSLADLIHIAGLVTDTQ